jgi:hypothetical protein
MKATSTEQREARENGCRNGAVLIPRQSEAASTNRLVVDVSRSPGAPPRARTSRSGNFFAPCAVGPLFGDLKLWSFNAWRSRPCSKDLGRKRDADIETWAAQPILHPATISPGFLRITGRSRVPSSIPRPIERAGRHKSGNGALTGAPLPQRQHLPELPPIMRQGSHARPAQAHFARFLEKDGGRREAVAGMGARNQGREAAQLLGHARGAGLCEGHSRVRCILPRTVARTFGSDRLAGRGRRSASS